MTIDEAERKQHEFDGVPDPLSIYSAKNREHIEANTRHVDNGKKIYKGRERIIEGFKTETFLLNYDKEEEQELRGKEEEKNIRDENGLIDYKRLERLTDFKRQRHEQ